jgi:hypothetical protein
MFSYCVHSDIRNFDITDGTGTGAKRATLALFIASIYNNKMSNVVRDKMYSLVI